MNLTLEAKWSGCIHSFIYWKQKHFVTTHKHTSLLMCYCKNHSQTFTLTVFLQFVILETRLLSLFLFLPVFFSHLFFSSSLSHSQMCQQSLCDNPIGAWLKGYSIWQSLNGDPSPLPPVSALFSRLDFRSPSRGTDCHCRMTASWLVRFLSSWCLWVCPGVVEACWSLARGVLQYLSSFWLMDLSLPLSEQLSEGRQSRSSL